MGAESYILPAIGGLAGYFGSKGANESLFASGEADRQAAADNRKDIFDLSANQNSPFKSTSPNDAGGIDTSFGQAGDVAAGNRLQAVLGDRNRQAGRNNITQNFAHKFNTFDDANAALQNQRSGEQAMFDSGLDKLTAAGSRANRDSNSGMNANTIDAIANYTNQNAVNYGPGRTQDFLAKSKQDELRTAQQQLAFLNPQGPQAPGFDNGGDIGGLTAALSQAPMPKTPTNYSGALPGMGIANAVTNYQRQAQVAEQNSQQNKLLDILANRIR